MCIDLCSFKFETNWSQMGHWYLFLFFKWESFLCFIILLILGYALSHEVHLNGINVHNFWWSFLFPRINSYNFLNWAGWNTRSHWIEFKSFSLSLLEMMRSKFGRQNQKNSVIKVLTHIWAEIGAPTNLRIWNCDPKIPIPGEKKITFQRWPPTPWWLRCNNLWCIRCNWFIFVAISRTDATSATYPPDTTDACRLLKN